MCMVVKSDSIYSETKDLFNIINTPLLTKDNFQFIDDQINRLIKSEKKLDEDLLKTRKKLEDLKKNLEERLCRLEKRSEQTSKEIDELENLYLIKLTTKIENLFDKILAILKTLPNHSHISINNRVKTVIV
jgi:predicted  nucleic acid-binding Zn-ribbon protein